MKVLIFNSYGGRIPTIIKPFVKRGIKWRTEDVIKFIEQAAVNPCGMAPHSIKTKIVKYYASDKNRVTYLFNEDRVTCEIVDVDTSRPWTITTYDGAEYIQYLDYDVIDEPLNYCEYKR